MEGSLSEAGTSPPYDSDTPHVPVARKTTKTTTVDPKIVMALNSLAAVQTRTTNKTAIQITQFLKYSATHQNAVI